MSEVNFDCFDDANKDEFERLQQNMSEIESENNCNRLLITKLEDELVMLRKCESRNVSVIKWKIHSLAPSRDLSNTINSIFNLLLRNRTEISKLIN